MPPPRRHRHWYHGAFAPKHKLRRAVTALAIGNIGKQREAATGRQPVSGHAAERCCNTHAKPRSHDTSRIAWANLIMRVGEEFPLQCPRCGGDIRLIAFITEPGPIREIPTRLGEPLEQRFGVRRVRGVLRGAETDAVIRNGNDRLSTYGLLAQFDQRAAENLVHQRLADFGAALLDLAAGREPAAGD